MGILVQNAHRKPQMQTIAESHASLNSGALERKHTNAKDMHVRIGASTQYTNMHRHPQDPIYSCAFGDSGAKRTSQTANVNDCRIACIIEFWCTRTQTHKCTGHVCMHRCNIQICTDTPKIPFTHVLMRSFTHVQLDSTTN